MLGGQWKPQTPNIASVMFGERPWACHDHPSKFDEHRCCKALLEFRRSIKSYPYPYPHPYRHPYLLSISNGGPIFSNKTARAQHDSNPRLLQGLPPCRFQAASLANCARSENLIIASIIGCVANVLAFWAQVQFVSGVAVNQKPKSLWSRHRMLLRPIWGLGNNGVP